MSCTVLDESTNFLVLGSDGLWEFVKDDELINLLSDDLSMQLFAERLMVVAESNSKDNITIVTLML